MFIFSKKEKKRKKERKNKQKKLNTEKEEGDIYQYLQIHFTCHNSINGQHESLAKVK